jgi:hypothetical protein
MTGSARIATIVPRKKMSLLSLLNSIASLLIAATFPHCSREVTCASFADLQSSQ